MATVERYKHLGLNEWQGNKYRISLFDNGFIFAEPVSTSSGRIKLMVPTEKGFEWLKKRGFYSRSSDKEGGILHQYWKRRLKELFSKQDFSVETEVDIGNNKTVDLIVSKNKRRIGIEVETGKNSYKQILGNIRKCLEHLDGVVSFILDAEKAGKVMEMVKNRKAVVVSDESRCMDAVLQPLNSGASKKGL